MATTTITIATPRDFSFWRTVYSHGWCALPPFSVDKQNRALERTFRLQSGKNVAAIVVPRNSHLTLRADSQSPLTTRDRSDLRSQALQCLRLTENYSDFFAEARKHARYRWIPKLRAGRLLRSPSVFEDVVKMICTTNCSWALTESMVGNLTNKLGQKLKNGSVGFPTPDAIADTSESYLRKEVRAGYRSPYILELAQSVAEGKMDLESWRTSTLPTEELYQQVLSVKGIGAYAAGNILKLLGRYDYLGIDSWVRKKFAELHRDGRKVRDSAIEKHYQQFGKWRGLFFWLEMTRDWYTDKFPF